MEGVIFAEHNGQQIISKDQEWARHLHQQFIFVLFVLEPG
jgi:hypothetical protein